MRQELKYTVVIVLSSLSTLGWVYLSRENTRREAVAEYSETIIPLPMGSAVKVPCDAFDVYIVPHDQPSESDARAAALEYEMNLRCRDADVK